MVPGCRINICSLYPNPSVRINCPTSCSPLSEHLHQLWLFPPCGQASSHTIFLSTSILSTRDLILQSPRAPPRTLSCLAKCHRSSRKHSASGPTPPDSGMSHWNPSQLSTNLESACQALSWLWRTPGPGDAAVTGEIIMLYPSLTPLSVTRMRADKCSDGRTNSCSITCSLQCQPAPSSKAQLQDQPTLLLYGDNYHVLPSGQMLGCTFLTQFPQALWHSGLSGNLHMEDYCLHGILAPACSALGSLCRMLL